MQFLQSQFEEAFKEWDPACDFQYLKSFRRARVQYNDPITAAKARIHMHGAEICGSYIKCYFAQVCIVADNDLTLVWLVS